MNSKASSARAPVLTLSKVADAHCLGVTFTVGDFQALARAIALVLIQEYTLARRFTRSADVPVEARIEQSDVDEIVARRLNTANTEHRDGYLFQLMMWLAAYLDLEPGDLVAQPHSQATAKGQDLIIVHRVKDAVAAITICEDKATVNARSTVRDKVWPEIKAYEDGGRRDELRSATIVTLGLGGIPSEEAERLVKRINWGNSKRRYRVRVTIEGPRNQNLFKGFADVVQGKVELRRGETALIPDMRAWMGRLANAVEAELQGLVG